MTVPIFDLPLEKKVLSMIIGGVRTTRDLAEECGISYEEIEELQKSDLFIPPYNRGLSRNPEKWVKDHGYTIKGVDMEIETKKIEIYPMNMRASFSPKTVDEERRTVELVWTTGAKVLRVPWFGENFYEELSMDPKHVRMKRLKD